MGIYADANHQRWCYKCYVVLLVKYKFCATMSLASLRRDLWQGLRPTRVFSVFILDEPFFASVKQTRGLFCCNEAKLRFHLKEDTCQYLKLDAGRLGASEGFLALPFE
jgi:hypothetical protein